MSKYIVCLDLETIANPIPEELAAAVDCGEVYCSNAKDKKAHLEKHWWKQAEGSTPVAVACCTVDVDREDAKNIEGIETKSLKNSGKEVVEFLEDYLTRFKPLKVITYGGERFDFPILVHQFGLHRKSPERLLSSSRYGFHIDLIHHVPGWFELSRPLKGKPHSACSLFSIPHSGTGGGDVKALWEDDVQNGGSKVLDYCFEDIEAIAKLYCKLSKFFIRE